MPRNPKIIKYAGVILLAVLIIDAYCYRLNFPVEPYYDEVHYIKPLKRLMYERVYEYTLTSHPPLWTLLTWPFVALLGERPAVWRLVSLLAGLLLILWIYFLARKILQNSLAALFAVFLFAFDCISLTQARIAMFNSLSLLFMIISFWAFLHYGSSRGWPRKQALLISGMFLGLGISTKVTSLAILFLIGPLLIHKAIKSPGERKALLVESIVFLLMVPVAIYVAVHAFIPSLPGCSWETVWEIQKFNFAYHLQVAATQTHPYSSSWWGWPLLLRPIWYYYTNDGGVVNGIICIGNPVIFWMLPVMAVYLLWDWVRHKAKVSGLILLGFFGQWLFYALGSRLKFFHYIYFAMPFAALGLARIGKQLWERGRGGRLLVCLYLVLVLGCFLYWYPLLVGIPVSEQYSQHHMWFRSWI